MAIEIGSEIEGTVTGVAKFGAFVSLPGNCTGLVHISQIADAYVTDVSKHVKVGDVIKVKVMGLAKGSSGDKYDLSIKQVGQAAWQAQPRKPFRSRDDKSKPAPGSFEDKITQFLKHSEEKLSDYKRNIETKQGVRKKKFKTKEA